MKEKRTMDIDEKAFWAKYLNMATNNILTLIQHIDQYVGDGKKGLIEDNGPKVITASKTVTLLHRNDRVKSERVIRNLMKGLPFLGVFKRYNEEPPKRGNGTSGTNSSRESTDKELKQKFPSKLAGFLCYASEVLYRIRNYYSHTVHNSYSLNAIKGYKQEDINYYKYYIEKIFDASISTTKERFYSGQSSDSEKDIFNVFRRQKGKPIEVAGGKMVSPPNPACAFKFYDEDGSRFTKTGMAFFIAFFLERAHANMMLKDPIIRNSLLSNHRRLTEDQLKAYERVFSIQCIRLPRLRMESEKKMTNETLGMDIINELHKCPRDLFELLSAEDQGRFRITDDEGRELLNKRFDDRFPYLCLNYLDRSNVFGSIRFQINMGHYWFDCYKKTLIDGTMIENRRLGKRIFVFRRIQDAVDYYQEKRFATDSLYWSPELGQTPPKEYCVDMVPQYHIVRNSIGLNFVQEKEVFPVFDGKKTRNPKSACLLSIFELPIITFLVVHGKGKAVQDTIKSFHDNWRRFCDDIAKTGTIPNPDVYNIDPRDIPDEFSWFYKNGTIKPFNTTNVTKFLQKEIDKTNSLKKRLENEQKYTHKVGKTKTQRTYTNGRIANIMIRELLLYQPVNENSIAGGKVTGPNFDVLRASLASFDYTKDDLCKYFENAKLLNNPRYKHPFLHELLYPVAGRSIVQFFNTYLSKKMSFLEDMKKDIEETGLPSQDTKTKRFYILRHYIRRQEAAKASPHEYISNMANRLRNEPVNLPRNLFDQLVREVLKADFPNEYREACEPPKRSNSTFMIMKYLEWKGDACQWFYNLPLSKDTKKFKKLFDKLPKDLNNVSRRDFETIVRDADSNDKPVLSGLSARFDTTEKNIRHEKLRDIVLIELAKNLLNLPKLKLSEIKEDSNVLGLIRKLDYTLKVHGQRRNEQEKRPCDMECKIIGEMMIKKYGNFQRVINDGRFASFMRLMRDFRNTTEVTYDTLQEEYDLFDRSRSDVFKRTLNLEKAILLKHPELKQSYTEDEDCGYFNFGGLVLKTPELAYSGFAITIARNAFAHSYYPEFIEQDNLDEDKDLTSEQVRGFRDNLNSQREKIRVLSGESNRIPITNAVLKVVNELCDNAIKQLG